jgi:hypothetical protein
VVTVRLVERAGEFECVSFSITSLRAGTSIGTSVVRDLPVASLVRDAVRWHLESRLETLQQDRETPPDFVHKHQDAQGMPRFRLAHPTKTFLANRSMLFEQMIQETKQKVGRASGKGKGRRYPPGHLDEVARIVRQARKEKASAQAAVAEAFDITRSAAANQIARAQATGPV